MIPRLSPDIQLSQLPLSFASGSAIEHFEYRFAALAKSRHAIAFPYGRTALTMLLKALNLQNSKVICPSYTCIVVPHSITFSDNIPLFVDCGKDSFLMDFELADTAASENDGIGAMISTPLFGEPVNSSLLKKFQKKHQDIHIIQDCAHSFMCEDSSGLTNKKGIAAIYGLNFSKIMTSVFGGMVTTDDDSVAKNLKLLRATEIKSATLKKSFLRRMYFLAALISLWPPIYGSTKFLQNRGYIDRFVKYYREDQIDMPQDFLTQMTGFEATIGIQQCSQYHKIVSHRQKVAKFYFDSLKECRALRMSEFSTGHTYSHFSLVTTKAEEITRRLQRIGIEIGHIIEYAVPNLASYSDHIYYENGQTKKILGNILNLPVHHRVTEKVAEKIVTEIKDVILGG